MICQPLKADNICVTVWEWYTFTVPELVHFLVDIYRRAPLRSDQHLLRERSALPRRRQERYGYSRDKRSDCVQVVIALIVTPEGFPLAYEVMAGNTADNTTLQGFLKKIEEQYGKAERIWVMDRGIPTEEVLQEMREATAGLLPGGNTQRKTDPLREGIDRSALAQGPRRRGCEAPPQDNEVYVLAQSRDRIHKERSMRQRQLKRLWKRLHELAGYGAHPGSAAAQTGGSPSAIAFGLEVCCRSYPKEDEPFRFSLRKDKLRKARRREGRYLLRTNLVGRDPAEMWEFYTQLVHVEEAFKNLKGDLALRPIHHQKEHRIEAHIFVAFMAYALHVTLRHRLRSLAPGLTPRAALEKFSAVQMIDVHLPTTDGRMVIMSRYTQPEPELQILLKQLHLSFPGQPPPRMVIKVTWPNRV